MWIHVLMLTELLRNVGFRLGLCHFLLSVTWSSLQSWQLPTYSLCHYKVPIVSCVWYFFHVVSCVLLLSWFSLSCVLLLSWFSSVTFPGFLSLIVGSSVTPHRRIITSSPDTRHWRQRLRWGDDSSVIVSASQLEGGVSNSPTLSETPERPLGKIARLNCPGKKQFQALACRYCCRQNHKKHFLTLLVLFFNVHWGYFQ